MSKKKLYTPLSAIFRRSLTSIPERFPLSFSPQIKHSIHLSPPPPPSSSSPFAPHDRTFDNATCNFSLGFPIFSRKSLCTKSAEKLENSSCWNCHAVPESAPFLVCGYCRCIQPVDDSVDYFEIFGLEKKYDIEDKNLEGKYKEWQKKLHPDIVHTKSQQERDFAAEQSARVSDAYRTLSKPLLRAIYMLKLNRVEVDEEQTIYDPELLAEIMEIREAVEEATNTEALNHILSQMQEKMKTWSDAFANAFQSQNFEEAKTSIQRMTYYSRAIDEVVKKL